MGQGSIGAARVLGSIANTITGLVQHAVTLTQTGLNAGADVSSALTAATSIADNGLTSALYPLTGTGATTQVAFRFTAPASLYGLSAIQFWMSILGSGFGVGTFLHIQIAPDNAGIPGAPLTLATAHDLYTGVLPPNNGAPQPFNLGATVNLTPGNLYWAIISIGGLSGADTVQFQGAATGGTSATWNGATWAAGTFSVRMVMYAQTPQAMYGHSDGYTGVRGDSRDYIGVIGHSTYHTGLLGQSDYNAGAQGLSTYDVGMYGQSSVSVGAYGKSTSGIGLLGLSGSTAQNPGLGIIAGAYGVGAGGPGGIFTSDLYGQVKLTPKAGAGPPVANAHAIGELYLDSVGQLYLCVAAGTPGTWQQVILQRTGNTLPTGAPTAAAHAGSNNTAVSITGGSTNQSGRVAWTYGTFVAGGQIDISFSGTVAAAPLVVLVCYQTTQVLANSVLYVQSLATTGFTIASTAQGIAGAVLANWLCVW